MPEDFNQQLRAAIARHTEFKPRTIEAAKANRRAYENRPETKEKHKKYAQSEAGHESMLRRSRKYAETHREQIAAKNRRWYAATVETRRAKRKEYVAAHKEQVNAYRAKTYQAIRNDPERLAHSKEVRKEWCKNNREKLNAYNREYRARKRAAKLAAKAMQEGAVNENVNTAA